MIKFGSVTLSREPANVAAWVERNITTADIVEFAQHPGWRSGLEHNHWGMPGDARAARGRPVRIGSLYWPRNASRWATAHFLATDNQVKLLRAAGYGAKTLTIGTAPKSVSASMYLLPPRPLSQFGNDNGLWLVTLVDHRWHWWHVAATVTVVEQATTWADLYTGIGGAIGATIVPEDVPAAYLKPPGSLGVKYEYLPLLLDAVARSCGQVIVRRLDGTVLAQSAATAKTKVAQQLAGAAALGWNKQAGGQMVLGDINATTIPETVSTIFPLVEDGQLSLTPYKIDTATGTAGLGKKIIRSCAMAQSISSVVVNGTELTDLAGQIAADWVAWQTGKMDYVYAAIVPWAPEGLNDYVEWHVAPEGADNCSTRIQRGGWDTEGELFHASATGFAETTWRGPTNANNYIEELNAANLWVGRELIYSGRNYHLPHQADVYTATSLGSRSGNVITTAITTIDGVTMTVGKRVLYNPGTADGGIYVYTSATTLQRAEDCATSAQFRAGMLVEVGPDGTNNANTVWQLTTANTITVNTTAITFELLIPTLHWVKRTASAGVGYDTTSLTSQTVPIAYSTNIVMTVAAGLLLQAGDILTFSGGGVSITGEVVSYSGTTLTLFVMSTTGTGAVSSWAGLATNIQGYWPGKWYDNDLNVERDVWLESIPVTQLVGMIPFVGAFYKGIRKTDDESRRVYAVTPEEDVRRIVPTGDRLAVTGAAGTVYYYTDGNTPPELLLTFENTGNGIYDGTDHPPRFGKIYYGIRQNGEVANLPVYRAINPPIGNKASCGLVAAEMFDQSLSESTNSYYEMGAGGGYDSAGGFGSSIYPTFLRQGFNDSARLGVENEGGIGCWGHFATGRAIFLGFYPHGAELASDRTTSTFENSAAIDRGYSPGIAPGGEYISLTRATRSGAFVTTWAQLAVQNTGDSTLITARGGTGFIATNVGAWSTAYAVTDRDADGNETTYVGLWETDYIGNVYSGGLLTDFGDDVTFKAAVEAALADGIDGGTF